MPTLILNTNVSAGVVTSEAVKGLSEVIAKALGKPESYVCVHINPGQQNLIFGGTAEPCGYADLKSIGSLGGAKNKTLSNTIGTYLETKFGIPKNRCYINFYDLPAADVGWNGATFA